MAGKNKTKAKISKEDYKLIRAKIKVKLGAYKINPDKAESYLERFKGLDIASIGEERVELLIREEAEKSEDPSMLFELGVISETLIKWEKDTAILDAMITVTEEFKKLGKRIDKISAIDLHYAGLSKIRMEYGVYNLLKMVKPDLKPWQLNRVPEGYWDDPKNVKEAVEWLVEEMVKEGKKIEDINRKDFRDAGLEVLLNKYGKVELLKMIKPNLKQWQLNRVPEGYWDNPKNVKEAVEWLVEKKAKEGKKIWEITQDDFKNAGLGRVLYVGSVYKLLKMIKPDLKSWQLNRVSRKIWDDPEHIKEAVEWLVEEMAKEGKRIEDISAKDFLDAGLKTVLYKKGLYGLLKMVKPDLKPWNLKHLPNNFWDDPKHIKEAVEWLVEKKRKKGRK